jgi:hypothetical protein
MLLKILLSISTFFPNDEKIAVFEKKIKKNELSFSPYQLVYWNPHEPFPSLGIAHFIWFPKNQSFPYEEAFPKLLKYLKTQGCNLPTWLNADFSCPWSNRNEFENDLNRQKELRTFLENTSNLQSRFIVINSFETFEKIIASFDETKKPLIMARFKNLLKDSRGLFALIDYNHFKGSGLHAQEFREGFGYGLKQVLEAMTGDDIEDFVKTAQDVLKKRVELSSGKEDKWLSGWLKRINRYREY